MAEEIENCPRMVKKRFIADAEVLLSSVANKGEVDRRLAEMYGIAPDYAQKLRLAYIPEKDVTLNVTKGDNMSIGPAKEIQLAKIKDPKKREKAKKEVIEKDQTVEETKKTVEKFIPPRPIKVSRYGKNKRPLFEVPEDKPWDLIESYIYNIETSILDVEGKLNNIQGIQKKELLIMLKKIQESISNLMKKVGG